MEWNIEKYEKHSDIQTRIGIKNIQKLSPQPEEKILDLGCGRGNLTSIIADKAKDGKIVGIDQDLNMINAAKQLIDQKKIKNISLLHQDVSEIDYDSEFDAVFSNIVLHWIKDLQELFKKVYQSLKKSGRISFAMLYKNIEPEKKSDRIKIQKFEIDQFQFYVERGHHKKFITDEEYEAYKSKVSGKLSYAVHEIKVIKEMLVNAGFIDIDIEKEFVPNKFATVDDYFAYRDSNMWEFFFSYFPEKVRKPIKDDLKELILEDWANIPEEKREIPIREEWPVIFVNANK